VQRQSNVGVKATSCSRTVGAFGQAPIKIVLAGPVRNLTRDRRASPPRSASNRAIVPSSAPAAAAR